MAGLYLYTTLDKEAVILEQVQEKLEKFSDLYYLRCRALNSCKSFRKGEFRSICTSLLTPIKLPTKKGN